MHVGVIADTHDDRAVATRAVELFTDAGVDVVIHCGDMIAPITAALFETDAFAFHAIRGNNDGAWPLASVVDGFGTFHGGFARIVCDGVRFGVTHGTHEARVEALAHSTALDCVLRGHTHQHGTDTSGRIPVINPGGVPIPGGDDAAHIAVVDTADLTVRYRSC